jgi:hypothetical protein
VIVEKSGLCEVRFAAQGAKPLRKSAIRKLLEHSASMCRPRAVRRLFNDRPANIATLRPNGSKSCDDDETAQAIGAAADAGYNIL